MDDTALQALGWGLLSAASLPLGAAVGLWLRPSARWTSSLMAFGAGALLAALTLELIAKSLARAGFASVALGFVGGALLFSELNQLLNGHGGFLRKMSTTTRYLIEGKRKRAQQLVEFLGRARTLQALPAEELHALVPFADAMRFPAGATVCERGDPGDRMYLIESGEVEVRSDPDGNEVLATLGRGDVFGEMALLTGEPRSATVECMSDVDAWAFAKGDFDRLLQVSPGLSEAVNRLLAERVVGQVSHEMLSADQAQEWIDTAHAHVAAAALPVSDVDVQEARASHGGAALAIWLGILLDGIPESLVIGSLTQHESVGLTLIAGVFLANFPEALSSAVGMRNQGSSIRRVMLMWTSLTVLTGIGALFGSVTAGAMSPTVLAALEAVAAGAMLAMIAETMLPEATEQGGPATGLMTVLGFLAAIFVSSLDPGHGHGPESPPRGPPAEVEPR